MISRPSERTAELPAYKYGGARAMVRLHEHYLRRFVDTWKSARSADLTLPETDDPDYVSLEILLRHVLSAARGYMVWICEVLELPDPEIMPTPGPETIQDDADRYLTHLADRWRAPLAGVEEDRFYRPEYLSRWKTRYCIDAMLEHAVMHPIRHEFQLRTLLERAGG